MTRGTSADKTPAPADPFLKTLMEEIEADLTRPEPTDPDPRGDRAPGSTITPHPSRRERVRYPFD